MGIAVRFNDIMQTVLAADDRAGLGAVTLWRQCVDLLAQHDRADRAPMPAQEREALLERLNGLRARLTETQRIATVVEMGRRLRSSALAEFFAQDRPSIAAAAMARADLPDAAWADMLPRLNPTARGVLRGRGDMGPETRRGLAAFGVTDLVLTTERQDLVGLSDMLLTPDMLAAPDIDAPLTLEPVETPPASVTALHPPARDEGQIRNLVDRIARFTSARAARLRVRNRCGRRGAMDRPGTARRADRPVARRHRAGGRERAGRPCRGRFCAAQRLS